MASRRNSRELLRRASRAFRPRPVRSPATWCPETVSLDDSIEASAGNYDLTSRPWWRMILEAFADDEVQSIVVKASTQVGKTITLVAILMWLAENAPAPAMVVLPDQTAAIEFRDRVYASAKITSAKCQRMRIPPTWKWNGRYIDLGSMRIYLAWSGSRQRLRGRPCRYVFLSETDAYKGNVKTGNPIEAAHQRTKAFFQHVHYHESSPSGSPSEISQLERGCTARYRWHAKCPKCGHKQEVRFFVHKSGPYAGFGGFGGLRNPKTGELVDRETARTKAHYLCEKGCKIENVAKRAFLESGSWQPHNECKSRRSFGVHLWEVFSETVSFGDTASKFIAAKEEGKLPEYFGNSLGEEFIPDRRVPEWHQLATRMAWTHRRGEVPAEAWFLTAGVDKQGDNNGVRYVVKGWAPARTSWTIDWGWLERVAGDENDIVKSDLMQLRALTLDRKYQVNGVNPLGKKQLGIRLLNIDSNFLPRVIYDWMLSLPDSWVFGELARVRAVRGDHKVSPELKFKPNVVEQNQRTGKAYEGGIEQWGIYVYTYYTDLLEQLNSEPGKPGAFYLPVDAAKIGKLYLQQICNFGPVSKRDEKTGRLVTKWDARQAGIPVDFWDCEIYARTAADMVLGDLGWSPQAWEQWRQSLQQREPTPVATSERSGGIRHSAEDLDAR